MERMLFMKPSFSLRTALITTLTASLLISGILFSGYLYNNIFNEIVTNTEQVASGVTKVHAQNINQYFESIENLAFTIKNNSLVQEALASGNDVSTLQQIRINEDLSSFLEQLSYSYDGVTGIIILSQGKSAYNYAHPFGFYEKSLLNSDELQIELDKNNESGYVPTFHNDIIKNSSVKNIFCYYEKLYYKGNYCGTLCILIDCRTFKNVVSDSLTSNEQLILLCEDKPVYPYDFSFEDFSGSKHISSDVSHLEFQEQPYLSVSEQLSNGWQLVDLIPTIGIHTSTNSILRQLLIALVIALGIYFICILFISHYVSKNLQLLCRKMSSSKNWHQALPGPLFLKEINQLNTQFGLMIDKLDRMLLRVKQEQQQIDRMELDLLQARINPHFLYNTLDAINWMAIEQGADDISEMSSDLAAMFRYALNNGSDITTLQRELAHLEKYLNIQRYRYDGRFTFALQVDEALYPQPFLNTILQPIVENCLLHGLRNSKDTIDISLSIVLKEEVFHILICDNGAGCDAALLNDYLASSQKSTKGYGVKNIHQRIQLRFGAEYGVHYHETQIGTTVEITMPVIREQEENKNV